jgi:hypothetical protein
LLPEWRLAVEKPVVQDATVKGPMVVVAGSRPSRTQGPEKGKKATHSVKPVRPGKAERLAAREAAKETAEDTLIRAYNDGKDIDEGLSRLKIAAEALLEPLETAAQKSRKYEQPYVRALGHILEIQEKIEKSVNPRRKGEGRKPKPKTPNSEASGSAEKERQGSGKPKKPKPKLAVKNCNHQGQWLVRIRSGWVGYNGNNPCQYVQSEHRCRRCDVLHPPCPGI